MTGPWPGAVVGANGREYFSVKELACKRTGVVRLHPGFRDALLHLREVYGSPMPVTSCCRSAAHNAAVGGHPKSLHVYDEPQHEGQLGTLAIDVAMPTDGPRIELVKDALHLGWSVGISTTFVHLDCRYLIGLAPQRLFGYG